MASSLPTRVGFLISLSSLLGALVTSLLAPRLISWYFKPPVDFGVNCSPATEWAMQRLIWFQIAGAVIAALLGLFLSFYLSRRSKVPENN